MKAGGAGGRRSGFVTGEKGDEISRPRDTRRLLLFAGMRPPNPQRIALDEPPLNCRHSV
jgi:hypothetical protein